MTDNKRRIHSTGNYILDRIEVVALPTEENKGEDRFNITNSVLSFDYFENILEPSVSIRMVVANQISLIDAIPIRGGERVHFSISTGNGVFEPTEKLEFYVYKVSDVQAEDLKETFVLHLVTKDYISNETTRCQRKYQRLNIADHVKSILDDVLVTENYSDVNIEKTSNAYTFIGCNKKPFHTLMWLSPKSIPTSEGPKGTSGKDTTAEAKGTAGFFFYENREGYNFKSLDNLISETGIGSADEKQVWDYEYTGVVQSGQVIGHTGPIINFSYEKNMDLRKSLRIGMYRNHTIFYDALVNEFTVFDYKLKDKKGNEKEATIRNTLNKNRDALESQYELYGKGSSRLLTRISDHGTLESGLGDKDSGADPTDMAKSFSRYNLLFTQALNILVPCNIDLKVGDIIACKFPERNVDNHSMSGRYLIRELRHHFVMNQNVTSLKLMRDSYGDGL
tara:strand:+ start:1115 stop:2464 length:1350 start_codon:yes stop_codon:yes gene_type:complete